MAVIYQQWMVRLPPHLLEALDALAVQTNSVAKRGPTARQPSRHVMLERLALGELVISEREPWSLPAGLAEQAEQVEHRQRIEQHTQAKESVRKAPVKLQQLNMLDLEPA